MSPRHPHSESDPARPAGDWRVVRLLLPYLWEFRGRVLIALIFLVIAKLANISVPLVMIPACGWTLRSTSRIWML